MQGREYNNMETLQVSIRDWNGSNVSGRVNNVSKDLHLRSQSNFKGRGAFYFFISNLQINLTATARQILDNSNWQGGYLSLGSI